MRIARRLRRMIDDRVVFLREFLKSPRQIGSVTPSSRFLERRIVELADTGPPGPWSKWGRDRRHDAGDPRRHGAERETLAVEINPQFCRCWSGSRTRGSSCMRQRA